MQISYPVLYSYFLRRHLEDGGGEVPSSRETETLKEQKRISHFDVLVKTEKLQILFDQSYPAILVSLVACALLSAILWPVQNNELLIPWILTLVATALVRFVLFMFYNRLQPQGELVLAWEWPYFVTLFMSSAAWGIGALYILPVDSQLHQLVIYFFLMGISGGAISVYSANRAMTVVSIAFVILPMTAWFIVQGTLLTVGIAISGILFSIAAMRTGKILSLTLNQSFTLAHELKSAKEHAERIANIDELSGLNNRRAFYENGKILVDYCLRNNEQLSVIIFDIDHFKQINDKLGHAAGDATIEHIGQILQSTIRKSDLCARIGGEEFAILLKPSVLDEAAQLAEILRQLINKTPISFQDEDFFISASFGVAVGISDLDSLLKRADSAMYKAKEEGRNTVICDNEMPSPMSGGHLNEK
jgi:diguanylate cyclase (GGDEF)-like protein